MLNIRPDYVVIVPLICTCKRLRDIRNEYAGIIRPELHGITVAHPEPGEPWYDYARCVWHNYVSSVVVQIVADKHWYGKYVSSYHSMYASSHTYTNIAARKQMLSIVEGSSSYVRLHIFGEFLPDHLSPRSTQIERRKFIEKARRIRDYLGLSAQQMLAAINEILG